MEPFTPARARLERLGLWLYRLMARLYWEGIFMHSMAQAKIIL